MIPNIEVEPVATRYGTLAIVRNDRPISEALRLYGEWAQAEIEVVAQLMPPDAVVIDGGSNIGAHACAFINLAPQATVHAFEPQPQLASLLRKNVAAHGGRVVVHEVALGSRNGRAFIPRLDVEKLNNAGANSVSDADAGGGFGVSMRTIDAIGLEKIDLIKLDIEGREVEALKGARKTIARSKPAIFCEINTLKAALGVFEEAERNAYRIYFAAAQAFNPGNFNRETRNIFGPASETALILLPADREAPKGSSLCPVQEVTSVDALAVAFIAAPRYGDKTPFDRDAVALRAALQTTHETAGKIDCKNLEAEQALRAKVEADLQLVRHEIETLRSERDQKIGEIERLSAHAGSVSQELASLKKEFASLSVNLEQAQSDLLLERDTIARERSRMEDVLARQNRDVSAAETERHSAQMKALAAETLAQEASAQAVTKEKWLAQIHDGIRDLRKAHENTLAELRSEKTSAAKSKRELQEITARYRNILAFLQPEALMELRRGAVGRLTRRRGALSDAYDALKATPLFDAEWYLTAYADVRASNFDPIVHYLLFGGYEGRDPSQRFDAQDYLDRYPDVRLSGVNPLLHYLKWGRPELRRIQPRTGVPKVLTGEAEARPAAFTQTAPSLEAFKKLAALREGIERDPARVQVIVPVFRGYDETLACLASVLSAYSIVPFDLIVVDDCSPEPELSRMLDELAQLGLFELRRNLKNLGFVGTVNRAMANGVLDVVLLNSDTLVFDGWLDRLIAHAASGKKVASVTPFTNNGTVCSYPKFCEDNDLPADTRIALIDQIAAVALKGRSIEVPTGVGFCMFIARAALNEVGLFDEATFGRGYGEENDFCMRAEALGWKNLHALDTFVFHSGEASFGDESSEGKRRGMELLRKKHPAYQAKIESFIAKDPGRYARLALDIGCALGRTPRKGTLCISHGAGGGIDRYLEDRAAQDSMNGSDIIVMAPKGAMEAQLSLPGAGSEPIASVRLFLRQEREALAAALQRANIGTIEVHSTVGWSHQIIDVVLQISRDSNARLKVMLHDYVFVCPQINLISTGGVYCGEEGEAQCRQCTSKLTSQPLAIHPDIKLPVPDIKLWRSAYGKLLAAASQVMAPSRDTAERFKRYFPDVEIAIAPHAENTAHIAPIAAPRGNGEPLRVAIIGAIGPHKGSDVLKACAEDAKRRALSIQFVVVGYSNMDEPLRRLGVKITGGYEDTALDALLAAERPHVAFLPSVWPETYCYTLSSAMAAQLPICVFDLGAQSERLRNYRDALLLPVAAMSNAREINDRLLAFAGSSNSAAVVSGVG